MAQLNVDPQKVDELLKRLNQQMQEYKMKHGSLKGFLKSMETRWNDVHYKTFMENFKEFDKAFQKAIHLSETVLIPNLKNVKKYAEEYQRLGRK